MSRLKAKKDAESAIRSLMSESGSPDHLTGDLFGELEAKYDDRAAAIVFGAIVERALEAALTTHFVVDSSKLRRLFSGPDSSGNGVLATFAAKIALGEAIGIYDDRMKIDLELVKAIRNAFAHAPTYVTFESPAITQACSTFHGNIASFKRREDVIRIESHRQKFTINCVKLFHYLSLSSPHPLKFLESSTYENLYPAETPT